MSETQNPGSDTKRSKSGDAVGGKQGAGHDKSSGAPSKKKDGIPINDKVMRREIRENGVDWDKK